MITTHVLDTAKGKPASGVPITLELRDGTNWKTIGSGATDGDGRLRTLTPADISAGVYRITFDTASYYRGAECFYPSVNVTFEVRDPKQHFHVPLLISPFGYSTYRGS